ncbi:MAG: DUF11 domain-containing protein, partial [Anaerolineae bacterium]
VTKTASPDPAVAGQSLTYSVTATNNGPDAAANVSITDQLPTNATFVSATPSAGAVCSTPAVGALGGTVSCTWAANTVVGGTRTITIVVNVCQDAACGTSVVNNVSVDSDLADPNTANNSFQLTTSVQSASDLAITKTDTPDPVIAGNNLTYSLVVDNLGPSNSAGTVVVDTLDPNTKFVSATVSPAGPTCSEVGGVVTCNLGTMGTGAAASCGVALPAQYTITIEVTVSALTPCSPNMCPGSPGAPLSNTATVSSTNCLADPDLANNTAVELTEVLAGADVLIDAPGVVDLTPNLLAAAGPEAGRAVTPLQASGDAADSGATLPLQLGGECVAPGDILEVTQTFSNTGPDAYTLQRNNPGPEFQANHPPQVVGMPGTCTILQGAGTCAVDATTASWNGTIAVGETIQLSYRVRVKGGLPVGTPMTFDGVAHYDVFNIQQNTATRASATTLVEVNCPPTVDPNSALAGQVHLPILNFEGQNDVCRTWIEVQNVGSDFTKAALVTWGEPGFCPPQCAGPLKVECSGLLKPGSTWN